MECKGSERQRERLRPFLANVPVKLWGHELLQPWNTQINILPISQMDHKPMHVPRNNIINHYKRITDFSGCTKTGHSSCWTLRGTNSPNLKMGTWQNCLGWSVTFDIRVTTGFRTAGSGGAKCRIYWKIYHPWNSPAFFIKMNLENGQCCQTWEP